MKKNSTLPLKDWLSKEGQVCWQSPANIALVKYWGKYPGQLPMNPSISFVLERSIVEIKLDFRFEFDEGHGLDSFLLNGIENTGFRNRIDSFLRAMVNEFAFLAHTRISIQSTTTFPHSAGIASSAAAFSALALCLCSLEEMLSGDQAGTTDFFRKASHIARLGSGSASRSLYDGLVVWGQTKHLEESSDEYAVRLPDNKVNQLFCSWKDAILIADSSTKKVSSSQGHALMNKHPYRQSRIVQAEDNLKNMLLALQAGDISLAGEIIENEALSLHGLMMSSSPGYVLMKPATLLMIEKIRNFREQTHVPVYFTLDAGPNIHLLYLAADEKKIIDLINNELSAHCQNNQWINDSMGTGPLGKIQLKP